MSTPSHAVPNLVGKYIHHGQYLCERAIGRGSWGVVYQATKLSIPGSRVAIKAISTHMYDKHVISNITREVDYHRQCSSAINGVLYYIDSFEDTDLGILFIVTEYCPDGDLLDVIISRKYSGDNEWIRRIFLQILDAVEACHNMEVYHRDLKPENILCKDGGRKAVIADFGFATNKYKTNDLHMGSEPFMSPEIRGGLYKSTSTCYSAQGDIWALGVILMTLVCGSLPWQKASLNDTHFTAFLSDQDFLYRKFPISRATNEILKRVFDCNPRTRISIRDLKSRVRAAFRFTTSRAGVIGAPLAAQRAAVMVAQVAERKQRFAAQRPAPPPPTQQKRQPPTLAHAQIATCSFERTVKKLTGVGSKATIIHTNPLDTKATVQVGGDIINNTPFISAKTTLSFPTGVVAGTSSRKGVVVRCTPPGELETDSETDSETETSGSDSGSGSGSSGSDSEGPITPETIAMDKSRPAIAKLEDVPDMQVVIENVKQVQVSTAPTVPKVNTRRRIDRIQIPAAARVKQHQHQTRRHPTLDNPPQPPPFPFPTNIFNPDYKYTGPLPLPTPPEIKAHVPIASWIEPVRKGEAPVRGVGVPLAYRAVKYAREHLENLRECAAARREGRLLVEKGKGWRIVKPETERVMRVEEDEEGEGEVEDKRVKFVMKDGRVRLATPRD